MNDFLKYRVTRIKELNSEKNYAFGIILGAKFMMLAALLVGSYTNSMIETLNSNGMDWIHANKAVMNGVYLAVIFLAFGKEIIKMHIIIINWVDKLMMILLSKIMYRHWRKQKQDSKVIDKIASTQSKLFGWWMKFPAKKRKSLVYSMASIWIIYQLIKMFGLDVIMANSLASAIDVFVR